MEQQETDFGAGAARVANMVEMAIERGMDIQALQAMVKAYMVQLAEWREAGSPGEPPSGFGQIGEFMHIQRKEK